MTEGTFVLLVIILALLVFNAVSSLAAWRAANEASRTSDLVAMAIQGNAKVAPPRCLLEKLPVFGESMGAPPPVALRKVDLRGGSGGGAGGSPSKKEMIFFDGSD